MHSISRTLQAWYLVPFFFMPWTQSESEFNNMGDIVMFFLRELLASSCLYCNEKPAFKEKQPRQQAKPVLLRPRKLYTILILPFSFGNKLLSEPEVLKFATVSQLLQFSVTVKNQDRTCMVLSNTVLHFRRLLSGSKAELPFSFQGDRRIFLQETAKFGLLEV